MTATGKLLVGCEGSDDKRHPRIPLAFMNTYPDTHPLWFPAQRGVKRNRRTLRHLYESRNDDNAGVLRELLWFRCPACRYAYDDEREHIERAAVRTVIPGMPSWVSVRALRNLTASFMPVATRADGSTVTASELATIFTPLES